VEPIFVAEKGKKRESSSKKGGDMPEREKTLDIFDL